MSVDLGDGENEMLIGSNVILATGSSPRALANTPFNGETVISSEEALQFSALPSSIVIIGGGVIGVEWASMLVDFGVKVTVVEAGSRILPTADGDISKEMMKQLQKRGVAIYTNATIDESSIAVEEHAVKVNVQTEEVQFNFTLTS